MTNHEIMLNNIMEQINKDHVIVMDFLYKHVEPEQMIDEIEDEDLSVICQSINDWYAESGEYWYDDEDRIIYNSLWLKAIKSAIEKFNEDYSTLTVTDEDLSRLPISKERASDEFV